MTLVIAEINKFGVVMAADTAETTTVVAASGRPYTRVKYGTRKLFPIKYLNGGVSYWGAGEIHAEGALGRIPTDVWLEDFIEREKVSKLEEFAYGLRRVLNREYGAEGPLLGFQVGGIGISHPGDNQPVFYRICNHDKKGGKRPEFDVEATGRFPRIADQPTIFADADDNLYFEILKRIEEAPLQSRRGDPIPLPTLGGRAAYQAAIVRFVSDLYDSAGLERTIGGKVTTLSVPFGGDLKFEES